MVMMLKRAAFALEEVTGDALFAVLNWWWDRTDSGEPLWTLDDEDMELL